MDKHINIKLNPRKCFLKQIREKTDSKDYSGALLFVANWIIKSLSEQGLTYKNTTYQQAMEYYIVSNAINLIHTELGCIPSEIAILRCTYTVKLIDFICSINKDAAKEINKALR